jgi:hypothetical protein
VKARPAADLVPLAWEHHRPCVASVGGLAGV